MLGQFFHPIFFVSNRNTFNVEADNRDNLYVLTNLSVIVCHDS